MVDDITEVAQEPGPSKQRDEMPNGADDTGRQVDRAEAGAMRCPTERSEWEMPDTSGNQEPSDGSFVGATGEFDRWFLTEESGGTAAATPPEPGSPGEDLNQLSAKIQDLSQSLLAAMAHQKALLEEIGRDAANTAATARTRVSKDAIAAVTSATSQYLEARAAADAVRHDLDKMLAVALEGACQIVADAEESAAGLIEQARASVADITSGDAPVTLDLRDANGAAREPTQAPDQEHR